MLDGVTWLLRILFAVRVSVINVVSSLALFLLAVQAQDLLADLSFEGPMQWVFWAGVLIETFVLWAFPVHYGARNTLDEHFWIIQRATRDGLSEHCRTALVDDVRERYNLLILLVPRMLGLMPFVVLAFGIRGALGAIGGSVDVLEETKAATTQLRVLLAADAAAAALFLAFVIYRKSLFPRLTGDLLHPLALVGTGIIFVAAYVYPIQTAIHLPRALLVPPLFGSLVLFTSFLQRLGNRTGFPFLVALGIVAGALTSWNASFDDLRTLPGKPDGRLTLADAAAAWKKANDCRPDACPHPVVVAIDGGASRAAFTAATFIGEVLQQIEPASGEAPTPGRRLFAISGVSGGAYGAVVIQSALRDGQGEPDPSKPPCHSARSTWFGYDQWAAQKGEKTFSWRQCLQALTSGDYLSPTIIGLAFRDFAAPPWQKLPYVPAMADRAGLLEMSWEQSYSATLKAEQGRVIDGDRCDPNDLRGLCRRAAHPADFVDPAGKSWMPMLFLNGTSVTTGRRIVSADLVTARPANLAQPGVLYPQAYDLREAMSPPCVGQVGTTDPKQASALAQLVAAAAADKSARALLLGTCAETRVIDGPDLRLSTAALTSARFPVVSPAGVFVSRDANNKSYGDEVVDGGYFENAGITTALDVVAGLRAQGLDPVLLSISNNPELDVATEKDLESCSTGSGASTPQARLARCSSLPERPSPTPLVFASSNGFFQRFFALVARPVETILGAREGHAVEAMGLAEETMPADRLFRLKIDVAPSFAAAPDLALAEDARCRSILPGVTLVMPEVSMSWWLSAAVQADLDIQRCAIGNRAQLGKIGAMLKRRDPLPKKA